MNDLAPAYLSTLASQVGALSAFLGGFAATFLGTLLAMQVRGRMGSWAIGFAVASSTAFIVTVVASTALVATLHPLAPATVQASSTGGPRLILSLGFAIGLYALLASLGLSGWTRSRGAGLTTSIASGLGGLLVTWMIFGMGG